MAYSQIHKKNDANQPEIVKALRDIGADVIILGGEFDLLVGYQGFSYIMEVKMPEKINIRSGYTKTQKKYILDKEWRGAPIHVVSTKEEALNILGASFM